MASITAPTETALVKPFRMYNADGSLMAAQIAAGPITNQNTGLGTSRDKTAGGEVTEIAQLSRRQLSNVYRKSLIIRKITDLLPTEAVVKWGELSLADGNKINTESYDAYEKRLKVRDLFSKAGCRSRQHGDYYLVMGIVDGRLWNEEVDVNNIQTIKWLKPMTRYDLTPVTDTSFEDPEHYMFSMDPRKFPEDEKVIPRRIHKSRILRFSGVKLDEIALEDTSGYNDSVITSIFHSFSNFFQGYGSSSGMLSDYNVFSYGLQGLADMMRAATTEQRKEITESLTHRFLSMQASMSISRGIIHDSEHEQVGWISRQYAGVRDILDFLEEVLIAESGLPRTKLVGSPEQGVFSESGLSDRKEFAQLIENYQRQHFTPNLDKLLTLIFAAKDGPMGGRGLDVYDWSWHDTMTYTQKEQAELEKLHAETARILVMIDSLHPAEYRQSRYGDAEYGFELTLDSKYQTILEERWKAKHEQAIAPPEPAAPPNNPPTNSANSSSRADSKDGVPLEKMRQDAVDGIIPIKVYLEACGYDVKAMNSRYWDEEY